MNALTIITIAISIIFLIIILSYYYLLFLKKKEAKNHGKIPNSITIIIPAHNEGKFIADAINSVLNAEFRGKKELIVVDDGSTDKTYNIAKDIAGKNKNLMIIKTKHSGKANAINLAVKKANSELIAVVDADSIIDRYSLLEAAKYFKDDKVGSVCSIIKVRNRKTFLGMWLHIEQLYNSLLRSLFAKINVNIVTPGPLSVYRKKSLDDVGGFETKGFSEDIDIALRLIKAGYKVDCCEKSFSETNMPVTAKGFSRQRARFARGWINIFKRHLKFNRTFMQIYTLPLAFFGYLQAVIMGLITLYNLTSGYIIYFASKGIWLNIYVLRFFFEWFSVVGIVKWFIRIISGASSLTLFDAVGLSASLLVYPLYIIAILKYDKKLSLWHIIPLFFMFPFWLLIMFFYIFNIGEIFKSKQRNIWNK